MCHMELGATYTSCVRHACARNMYAQHALDIKHTSNIFLRHIFGIMCIHVPHIKLLASIMCLGGLCTFFTHHSLCHSKYSSHCPHSVWVYTPCIDTCMVQNTALCNICFPLPEAKRENRLVNCINISYATHIWWAYMRDVCEITDINYVTRTTLNTQH